MVFFSSGSQCWYFSHQPSSLFHHSVLGLFQKKIPGGERRQAIYFSMGGRCAHFSNYMGPWCLTNSDYIGGGVRPISNSVWVVVLHSLRRGEERILSANRLINVAIRKLRAWQNRSKSGHFCFCLHM